MIIKLASSVEKTKDIIKNAGIQHVAIIMDGNRRWAHSKHLPSVAGHNEGVKSLKQTVQAAIDFGIKYLTVYAFSTENWGRKKEEVQFLMLLLQETIKNETNELNEKGVRIRIIGDLNPLSDELKETFAKAEDITRDNDTLNLQVAINYGARKEITNAVKNIVSAVQTGNLNLENINEDVISNYLYTSKIPDPDLLIRTGGEQRISNYLLWQIAYTEIYVTEIFWPEFGEEELSKAVMEFSARQRRFGKD
ncbi:MAG: di-trans,poly-cis-decaprenylcistransferase [Candidatus Melainabacteria bacterium GWA2_34_9]|nr:MAG: di-trans,poly-cis-decaprenylcistransferase [Candidatus Melainabacteria bacterium GWA2_34_9]